MFKAIFVLIAAFTTALQPITTAQINITDTPPPQIKPIPMIRLTVRREPDGAIF